MNSIVSGFVSIKFVQMLSKPFKKWKAFDMGLIDKKGIKIRDAETKDEEKEFASWLNIIRKIKILLNRFAPGGRVAQLASFATALYLLKEDINKNTSWEGADIINIIAEDIFLVDEQLNEIVRLEFIQSGKYIIENEFINKNNIIILKNRIGPTEWFYDIPMYEVKDTISGNKFIVTKGDLIKI